MLWRRGKSWGRSFLGRKGGAQPVRDVYLRTLANLANPSEVRSVTRPRDRFAARRCTATSFRRLCTASPETNSQCSVRMRLQKA